MATEAVKPAQAATTAGTQAPYVLEVIGEVNSKYVVRVPGNTDRQGFLPKASVNTLVNLGLHIQNDPEKFIM